MGKSQSQCSLDVNMDICLFGARHSQEQDEKKNQIDKFGWNIEKK